MDTPTFRGARGVYRPLVVADGAAMHVAHADPAVHHFWSCDVHASVEESVKYTADTESQLPAITYWLMGSLNGKGYDSLALGAPLILAGVLALYLIRWRMNILPLSEDEARASGTPPGPSGFT